MSSRDDTFDVIVVGAGPAGMAAAATLAEAGRRVCLIDEAQFTGGQIWRNRGEPPKGTQANRWRDRVARAGDTLVWLRQSRVVAKPTAKSLLAETPDGPRCLTWGSLILATGARELFLPFPGWTLPGVVGAGGIQALVKQGLSVDGKRILVAGTGPLLWAVADLLKRQGGVVPFVLEQTAKGKMARFGLSLVLEPAKLLTGALIRARMAGTTFATSAYPLSVCPTKTGLKVTFQHGRRTETAECDYLACGFSLIPNNELAQLLGCELESGGIVRVDDQLRTTKAEVYAIGELTGIGGVEKATLEGQLSACLILGRHTKAKSLQRRHSASLRFVRRLESAFALRPELLTLARPETTICRCEDVSLAAVQSAFSGRDAKLQTRCGMGPCQGRVCGPILQRLLNTEAPQVRPPLITCSIQTLAANEVSGEGKV